MKHINRPIIVSLTTIPSRLKALSRTVDSLLNQSVPPSEIRLYVPNVYRRFPEETIEPRDVDPRVTLILVERDLGPLTKMAYVVDDFEGQDVDILVCDDDMDYEPDWIELFVAERQRRPDDCLVQSGGFVFNFSDLEGQFSKKPRARYKGFGYRLKRALSGLQWKPRTPYVASGYVDIGEGWAGFFLSPKYFEQDFKEIPDEIFLVDDIWISAYLTLKGIDIWLIKNALRPQTSEIAQIDALNRLNGPFDSRVMLNNRAVHLLRSRFNIWQ